MLEDRQVKFWDTVIMVNKDSRASGDEFALHERLSAAIE